MLIMRRQSAELAADKIRRTLEGPAHLSTHGTYTPALAVLALATSRSVNAPAWHHS